MAPCPLVSGRVWSWLGWTALIGDPRAESKCFVMSVSFGLRNHHFCSVLSKVLSLTFLGFQDSNSFSGCVLLALKSTTFFVVFLNFVDTFIKKVPSKLFQ